MVCCDFGVVVFFVKQKSAYEMRISDWSSDVCSSDLGAADADGRRLGLELDLDPAVALFRRLRLDHGIRFPEAAADDPARLDTALDQELDDRIDRKSVV